MALTTLTASATPVAPLTPTRPAPAAPDPATEADAPADGTPFADLLGRCRGADKADADAAVPVDAKDPTAPDATSADPATAPTDLLPPWLAALHLAPPPTEPKAATTAATDAAAIDPAADPGAAMPAPPRTTGLQARLEAADAAREPAKAADPAPARIEAENFAALRDEAVAALAPRDAAPTERQAHENAAEPLAALAGTAGAARSQDVSAPTAAVPTVAVPLDSPEFGRALGVQVSLLARDGLQEARLQLNPAEMGPVSVQIALDGQQAQVHFGAEVAATRQAIESSLPELAAALREAGFTLAGGGVSQGSAREREPTDGNGGGDGRPALRRVSGAAGEHSVTVRPAPRRATLGALDLYA